MAADRVHVKGRGLSAISDVWMHIHSPPECDEQDEGRPKYSTVLHLSVRNNHITEAGFDGLVSFPALVTLNASQNRVKSLHPVTSSIPPTLLRLNLADNLISYLPSSLASLSLLDLDLSGNKLSGTVNFPPIATLRTLKLSRNALASISGLDSLTKLDSLDVSENQLMDVEDLVGVRDCDKLGKLICHSNPLCLCPRYRYAILEAVPELVLLDGHTVPKFASSLKSFCMDHEDAVGKCHVTGCGLPRHVCPAAAANTIVAFADASSHHSGLSSSRSRTSVRPPSPIVCDGEGVVACQPRREFDVITLPVPRVIRVHSGHQSSLDDRLTENFLRELHDKDEQARQKVAVTPTEKPRALKPRRSNSGLTHRHRACRCDACAARLGVEPQSTTEALKEAPRPNTSSSSGVIRPRSGPPVAIRKQFSSNIPRPTSGSGRKPPLSVTVHCSLASSHPALSISPCETHGKSAPIQAAISTVVGSVLSQDADVWAAPVKLDPIALSRCAAMTNKQSASNNWTVEPRELVDIPPHCVSGPSSATPIQDSQPLRAQSASGVRAYNRPHVRSRSVNGLVTPSTSVPSVLSGMIRLDDRGEVDEPVVGAISRVLRARRSKEPRGGTAQSFSVSIAAAASPSKQPQPSLLGGFMKGIAVKSR